MQASSNFVKAIHICLYLDLKPGELKSSTELAESVDTNPVVIRRLIALLKKGGVVDSVAGARGGFKLAKAPGNITLWDIYLSVREEQFFNRPKVNKDCGISCNLEYLIHDTFDAAEQSMKTELIKVNISQLSSGMSEILDNSTAIVA